MVEGKQRSLSLAQSSLKLAQKIFWKASSVALQWVKNTEKQKARTQEAVFQLSVTVTNSPRQSTLRNERFIWVYTSTSFFPLTALCLYWPRTWVWAHGRESCSCGVQKEEGVELPHPLRRHMPSDLAAFFKPPQVRFDYFSVTLQPGHQAVLLCIGL